MLQIVILVCATSLSPQDCQRDTALDVISGPQAAGVTGCGLLGQATMAETGLGRRSDEYIKIRCEPLRPATLAAKL